jgi:protein SCO1/2
MRTLTLVLSIVIAAAVIATAFVGGFWYAQHRTAALARLPVLGPAPSYTLTNQTGQAVASSSFLGKVQVVTFLFPYCTGYCPLIALNLASLETALKAGGLADHVQFVAFDVDPAHTGPKEMAAFLAQYGWDPKDPHWQFLTGSPEAIRNVVTKGFFIDFEQVSEAQEGAEAALARQQGRFVPEPEVANPLAEQARPDYDVVHNDALVVVDPKGRMRVVYDEASRVPNAELLATITRLAAGG